MLVISAIYDAAAVILLALLLVYPLLVVSHRMRLSQLTLSYFGLLIV